MEITKVTRKNVDLHLTATLANGSPTPVVIVGVALLPVQGKPSAQTVWLPAAVTDGVARFLLAGSEAGIDGALVAPYGRSDLWARVLDAPEVDAVFIEAVHVR